MKLKRLLAAFLTVAAVCAMTVIPAQASSFSDIYDPDVSRAAETLHALGIVEGMGDGTYQPDGHFTRVQFCKMAIEIMGKGDLAKAQMNRTIFSDVGGAHWGRGYVNLAATMIVDESAGTRLMMGTGNGCFKPDQDISYREAVTIILRMLGYGEQANQNWPYGAIQASVELGLDEDLGVSDPAAALTRGQAALLFCRLLAIPAKGEEEPYAHTLCTLVEDAIILATNATINGQSGWVVTTAGGPYRPAGQVDSSLLGQRGDVLLDKDGRFITLLSDMSQCVSVTVSRVLGNYIQATTGARYTFEDSTPVYSGTSGTVSTYKEMLPSILPGSVVTIYLEEGEIIGMFCSVTTAENKFWVAQGTVSTRDLESLVGSDSGAGYTIRKNGATISLGEIKEYDVLTYDPISKVINVCDTRIDCVYENASPSPSAPAKITVLGGNQFDVMADAMDSIAQYSVGQSFTLLLTSGGQVAGAVKRGVSGNAMGVISGSKLTLIGVNKTLDASKSDGLDKLNGQLVSVSGIQGQARLKRVSLSGNAGSFEKSAMQLGRLSVSDSVQIYERGTNGLAAVSLFSLDSSIPASKISGYHTDSSGNVDLIILRSFTGDSDAYGLIEPTSRFMDVPVEGDPVRVDERWYFWRENGTVVDRNDNVVIWGVFNPSYVEETPGNDENVPGDDETLTEDSEKPEEEIKDPAVKPDNWYYTLGDDGYVRDDDGYMVDEDGNRLNSEGYLVNRRGEVVMEKKEIPQLKFTTLDQSVVYDVDEDERVRTCFGTISVYEDRDGNEYAEIEAKLTEVSNARSADFYTTDGVTYVQVKGKTYEVASDVQCYNVTAASERRVWDEDADDYVYVTETPTFDSLLEARTFSATLTLYIDSVGQKVRVVTA